MIFTSPARNALLCFLLLIPFFAVPVQSQTPQRLTDPTSMADCGLPATWAEFTSAATVTTFSMTADCVLSNGNVGVNQAFLYFSSGAFTINGNGHSIIGPTNGYALFVQNTGSVLNLNHVTIRQSGAFNAVAASAGARLNARRVIFRDNATTNSTLRSYRSEVYLEDVQFLNNRVTPSFAPLVLSDGADALVVLTNSIFRGNTVDGGDIFASNNSGAARLEGCLISENNFQLDGVTPANGFRAADVNSAFEDNSSGRCSKPKKKEKPPTPTPTATPRPAYGASYVALQTATGMTFEATYGLDSGVHFRQLDGAGIGVQSIIDSGYLAALDVYGYVEQGVEVCFPQIGRIIFLDARTMPRTIAPLESTVRNSMTCVSINSPGSLVLLPN